eukprot:m.89522 g.89522  ORF g.89522 m.89522 type:complete len:598 (-) comp14860_c0_seq1:63-1856(-)
MSDASSHVRKTTTTTTSSNVDTEAVVAELNRTNQALADAKAEAHKWHSKYDSLEHSHQETINDLQHQKAERDAEIKRLSERVTEAESKSSLGLKKARRESKAFSDDIMAKLAAAEEKASAKEKELSTKKREMRRLMVEKAEFEEQANALRDEVQYQARSITSRDEEIERLRAAQRQLKTEFGAVNVSSSQTTELNLRIDQLQKENAMLKQQLSDANQRFSDTQSTESARSKMHSAAAFTKAKSEFAPVIKDLKARLTEEKARSEQLTAQIATMNSELSSSQSSAASSHASELKRLQAQHQSDMDALRRKLEGQVASLQAQLKQADAQHRQLEDQLLTRERSVTTTTITKPANNDAEINALRQQLQQDMSKLQLELKQSASTDLELPAEQSMEQWRQRYEHMASEKQALHSNYQQQLFHFDQQVKLLQQRLHDELTSALQRQSELHSQDLKTMQKRMASMSEQHANEAQRLVAQPRRAVASSQRSSVKSMSSQEASVMISNLNSDHSLTNSKLDLAQQQLNKAMAALQSQQQKTKQLKGAALSLTQSNRSASQAVSHLLAGQDGGFGGQGSSSYSHSSSSGGSTVATKSTRKTVQANE